MDIEHPWVPNRPRRAWPSAVASATAVVVALALLTAACSGSGPASAGSPNSPGTGASARSPSAVAYSGCMRSKGIQNYPDPDSSGQLPKTDAQVLGVSNAQYRAAQQACRHLLPAGGSPAQQDAQCMQNNDCMPAQVQQMMTADLKLARCMRSHGVPNFPDPTNGGAGGPWFNISRVGISDAASHTAAFMAKLNECSRLVGDNAPESFG
jgi:hypothetical protein